MPFTLTMPKLSPTMEEGTIAKWHKKEGERVDAGDLLIEVATDKATVEHNALDEGFLRKILIPEGSEAIVNQPIAIFTEEAAESIEGYQPEGEQKQEEAPVEEEKPSEPKAEPKQISTFQTPVFEPEPPLTDYTFSAKREATERVFASPLAKKLAKERGLDLSTVRGTGPSGRIMQRDLERAQPDSAATFSRHELPTDAPGSYEEVALTPMRKVISRRLQESKSFIPHFYVTQSVDAAPMITLREQLKEMGLKVTFNDFVLRASALALREHPEVNRGFNSKNSSIIRFKTIDISLAVSIPDGLITPIIRHADFKNLGELSVESKSLAKRALAGKLQEQEYKGGSFTVSNLGMFGITEFQAIINPPQAALLAISGISDQPVIKDQEVVPGKIMNISLSADHRVIDGVLAAKFVKNIQKFLENPASLLL